MRRLIAKTLLTIGWLASTGLAGCSDDTTASGEQTAVACRDSKDNDGDGQIDCEDSDCKVWTFCAPSRDGGSTDQPSTCTCDDGLDCTEDSCNSDGSCTFTAKAGFCAILGSCYADQTPHPDIPCLACEVARSQSAWSAQDGTSCDDENPCTKGDVCRDGICRGDFYSCADSQECTDDVCDGAGGCTNPLKSDWCRVNGRCYPSGAKDPFDSCNECAPATNQAAFTTISGGCVIEGVCYRSGETDATRCKVCDPTASGSEWTDVSGGCTIGGFCYANGAKDDTGCRVCDPNSSTTSWTDASYDCRIDGRCYAQGDADSSRCGVCDPAKATDAWTLSAENRCS
jgi:hypothetical protein